MPQISSTALGPESHAGCGRPGVIVGGVIGCICLDEHSITDMTGWPVRPTPSAARVNLRSLRLQAQLSCRAAQVT